MTINNHLPEQSDAPVAFLHFNPNASTDQALEHASNLLGCINELILDASLSDAGPHSLWAAHYLGDMAKAIIDGAVSKRSGLSGQDQTSPRDSCASIAQAC
jgi:hypothetical protein